MKRSGGIADLRLQIAVECAGVSRHWSRQISTLQM